MAVTSLATSSTGVLPAKSMFWPAVILVSGLVGTVAVVSRAAGWPEGLMLGGMLVVLAGIAAYDVHALRAPNRVVYPLALFASAAPFAIGVSEGVQAVTGGMFALALLLVAVLASRGAMGYGDAKVAYVCGAVVGLSNVLPLILATFALGSLFAGAMLLFRIRGRKDVVAFTPMLFAGVIAVLLWADANVYTAGGG